MAVACLATLFALFVATCAFGADTLWFGGVDPGSGLAVPGGVWDFDDCTAQGWTSVDVTSLGPYFLHVTQDSINAHGDPTSTVITANGSQGSMWCGVHQDDAALECWPGGMGYSNGWDQSLEKEFTYSGAGDVTISFDYFVDAENGFDFAFVYLRVDGELLEPLNTSVNSPIGVGYTGSVQEGNAIGSPPNPAHDTLVVDGSSLPPGPFSVVFMFVSDIFISDAWGDGNPGFFDSVRGAFGVDNVAVTGVALADTSDFEPGGMIGAELDGWTPHPERQIGSLFAIRHLSELEPLSDPENCPLNGCVMIAAEPESSNAHPLYQFERLISNAAAVPPGDDIVIVGDSRNDFFANWCFSWGVRLRYYPWTCPETSEISWSPWPILLGGANTAECEDFHVAVSDLPSGLGSLDSVQVIVELERDFEIGELCDSGAEMDTAPFWDNIRVGVVKEAVAVPTEHEPTPIRIHSPIPLTSTGVITIETHLHSNIVVELFDVSGRRLYQAYLTDQQTRTRIAWSRLARGAAAGVYFLSVSAGNSAQTERIVYTR